MDDLAAAVRAAPIAVAAIATAGYTAANFDEWSDDELCWRLLEVSESVVGPWLVDTLDQLIAAYGAVATRPGADAAFAALTTRVRHLTRPLNPAAQQLWHIDQPPMTLDQNYCCGEFPWRPRTITDPPALWHRNLVNAWEINDPSISRHRVAVDDDIEVYEVHSPADWAALVARFPADVAGQHMSYELPGVNQPQTQARALAHASGGAAASVDGDAYQPDWVAVAAVYDAVHLSWAGFITAQARVMAVPGITKGVTLMRYWDSESTLWLTDRFTVSERLPSPQPSAVLASSYDPAAGQHGAITFDVPLSVGTTLVATSAIALTPTDDSNLRLLERQGSCHHFQLRDNTNPERHRSPVSSELEQYGPLTTNAPLQHWNEGPISAYLLDADGAVEPLAVAPATRRGTSWHAEQPAASAAPTPPTPTLPASAPLHPGVVESWPRRILHIDLARQWQQPDIVHHLIDVAAEYELSHLHLHLTDDEAWRLPVAEYPQLAAIGGTRGHGLPIGPQFGSGPDSYGRAYTETEITAWVQHGTAAGIELVPEVDMPGHNHAALAAYPGLCDPDDTTAAISVQNYVDNALVPGHPMTEPLVEAIVATLAELFPTSEYLHLGGDEVASGAWNASPIVQLLMRSQNLTTTRDVEAYFHQMAAQKVRAAGRRVGAWQEAAESGGLQPDDGYVVVWRSADSGRALARQGYDIVLSPGEVFYFDMAYDSAWSSRGASWAGPTTVEDVRRYRPGVGWTEAEYRQIVGIQACLWGEYIHTPRQLWQQLVPRLAAFAAVRR